MAARSLPAWALVLVTLLAGFPSEAGASGSLPEPRPAPAADVSLPGTGAVSALSTSVVHAPQPASGLRPPAPARDDDDEDLQPLRSFQKLVRRASARNEFQELSVSDVRRRVGDLLLWERRTPGHEREVDQALLDLLGLCIDPERPVLDLDDAKLTSAERDTIDARLRTSLARSLATRLDTQSARWIAREVLMIPRAHARSRRVAAAWLMARERHEEGLMALLILARGDDVGLSELAILGLAGWEHPSVHDLFLEVWRDPPQEFPYSALAAVERHYSGFRFQGRNPLEARLADVIKIKIGSVVWQEASRAVALTRPLTDEVAVPLLIEALQIWVGRGEAGRQSLRLQFEIVNALEERSGRSIGLHVKRWETWWRAVRRGETPLVADDDDPRTVAQFFGLRPMSDRIAFLIDRSGSMKDPFEPDGRSVAPGRWSRYDEAVQQMIDFLRTLGPACRFRLAVFSNGSDVWHKDLRPADARNLKSARNWLLSRRPDGGTNLRGGVERALDLKRGVIDVETLGIDTVVVLCDGATDEGSAWVEGFLERVNSEARIVFHCVQIGDFGDGTLEALARHTGGDFVRQR